MFLTAYNVPHYLLHKGLITPESVVDGDFTLAEAGRRNRNFKVLRRKEPGLFLKQIKTTEPQAIMTLQREADFYRHVHTDSKYAAIRRLIPEFVHYEPSRYALTLKLTVDAESMNEQHLREQAFPESTARLLGAALATVHSHGAAFLNDPLARSVFPYQVPWPLTLDQTGFAALDNFGPIGSQVAAAMRQLGTLQPRLSALRSEWQYDSLIHGDMKWDNCLVKRPTPGGSGQSPDLTIVDWELADIGDGAWDVATIFKEYIVATIVNASAREAATAQNLPGPAAQTIEALRPSIRAFWQAYASGRNLSGPTARMYLERAVKLTAGRMVIAVLEYVYAAPQFNTLGMKMLQTSLALLEAPQMAAVQMIGIPLS